MICRSNVGVNMEHAYYEYDERCTQDHWRAGPSAKRMRAASDETFFTLMDMVDRHFSKLWTQAKFTFQEALPILMAMMTVASKIHDYQGCNSWMNLIHLVRDCYPNIAPHEITQAEGALLTRMQNTNHRHLSINDFLKRCLMKDEDYNMKRVTVMYATLLMHIPDVYYSGKPHEIALAIWRICSSEFKKSPQAKNCSDALERKVANALCFTFRTNKIPQT